jgi:hypothetical protein
VNLAAVARPGFISTAPVLAAGLRQGGMACSRLVVVVFPLGTVLYRWASLIVGIGGHDPDLVLALPVWFVELAPGVPAGRLVVWLGGAFLVRDSPSMTMVWMSVLAIIGMHACAVRVTHKADGAGAVVSRCPPSSSICLLAALCNDVTHPHLCRANPLPSFFWQTLGEEYLWHALFFLTLALVCWCPFWCEVCWSCISSQAWHGVR